MTVPPGLPPVALPVTVAVSLSLAPRTRVVWVGVVDVVVYAAVTSTHSSVLESELAWYEALSE
jgi:hypothetical protein